MSGNSTDEIKDTVYAAGSTSGEWAQNNVVNPIHSYVTGEKNTESQIDTSNISDEESEKIDRMEKEKVAEFLQERHKSNAATKRK
ncbi:hypothetical protein BDW59DRAFT_15411 [Aspergillus cavernicola]|uniref:Uncharacterized protein n=1 Tax=Aspergillus cavernicola TaxID=176166 RepID=A0ABR4HJJ5_9EURO